MNASDLMHFIVTVFLSPILDLHQTQTDRLINMSKFTKNFGFPLSYPTNLIKGLLGLNNGSVLEFSLLIR